MDALQSVVASVRSHAPDLVDEWEATAWVESLGWTDERIRSAVGLADTRALGRYIYEASCRAPVAAPVAGAAAPAEPRLALVARTYSTTLIYALPWLLTFAVEGLWPDAFSTHPDMAGPISVAVMFSLIMTGGFVQAIARKSSFYLGMEQMIMARHVGLLICRAGLISTAILALAGLVAGAYFEILGSMTARFVAVGYFVILSALWLACALLAVAKGPWRVPMVFTIAALVFLGSKVAFSSSALVAQTASVAAALAAACALVSHALGKASASDSRTEWIVLPRRSILTQTLLPYFGYGVAYFLFLFADRLSAGSALPAQSGLPFGIAVDYKRGIDLAFLVFLLVAGAVECSNVLMMRFWRREADRTADCATLRQRLLRRRRFAGATVLLLFAASGTAVAAVADRIAFLSTPGFVIFVTGCVGYALFASALLDALTLFSINRPGAVLGALLPALLVNLATGYAFSHVAGAEFAVVGLVLGALAFVIGARARVHDALRRPDFAYGWA